MKPLKIITSDCPAGHFPVEFPAHTGIEPFTLPVLGLIDREALEENDKWLNAENDRREKANAKLEEGEAKKGLVTEAELAMNLLPHVIGDDLAKKVLARPEGEVVQVVERWLTAHIDTEADLGES